MTAKALLDLVRDGYVYQHIPVLTIPGSPAVWLKADALTGLADGDPVGTWTDVSGNARNFTATGSARPTYKTGIINGMPVLRFDNSDDEMGGGDLSAVFASAGTLSVTFRVDGAHPYFLFETANKDIHWNFGGTGYWGTWRSARVDGYPSPVPNAAGNHYFTLISSAARFKAYIDGTGFTDQSASFSAGTTSRLGKGQNGNGQVDMAEVIMWNSELNTTELAVLHAYLAAKYAI